MTRALVKIGLPIIILIIGIALFGWYGIKKTVAVAEGACENSYVHYQLRPFVRDLLHQCSDDDSCGLDEGLGAYYAKIGIVQCLCQKPNENGDAILSFYARHFVASFVADPEYLGDVDSICSEVITLSESP